MKQEILQEVTSHLSRKRRGGIKYIITQAQQAKKKKKRTIQKISLLYAWVYNEKVTSLVVRTCITSFKKLIRDDLEQSRNHRNVNEVKEFFVIVLSILK